ncbi:MAG: ATP-binding protein [Mariprofundaceae bacterium]|nr:ATP-binding protein [Mariprofundaceae bacterium]
MKYSPFKKPISKLEALDLEVLRSVSEGWYIEYKRQLPKQGKIAKSVTSFANTYGGWLFYGIDEGVGSSRTASDFCGIENAEEDEVHIREALVYHSNPEPYFETHIINGPCEEIGLPGGRAVLVVYIPQSNSLPHIHGSGRIFRRVSDASEPIVEKDRARLDMMWEQKKDSHKRLKTFLEASLPVSVAVESPMLHMYLMTDPVGTKGHQSCMSFKDFTSIMREGSLVFDNIYTGSSHFVARYTQNNDINGPLFSWQYFNTGASVVSIPFSAISINERYTADNTDIFTKYQFGEDFLKFCDTEGKKSGWVIDLNKLCPLLLLVLSKHNRLLLKDNISPSPYIKFRLENIGNTVSFIDMKSYMDFISTHGLPAPLQKQCYFPDSNNINTFVAYQGDNSEVNNSIQAMRLFTYVIQCFGIPTSGLYFDGEDIKDGQNRIIKDLFNSSHLLMTSKKVGSMIFRE